MLLTDEELAEIGYRSYSNSTGNKTWDNREMPRWDDLPDRIKRAWTEASASIKVAIDGSVDPAELDLINGD